MASKLCRSCRSNRATKKVIVRSEKGEKLCELELCKDCLDWRRKTLSNWFEYEEIRDGEKVAQER